MIGGSELQQIPYLDEVPSKQEILEMRSVRERLNVSLHLMQKLTDLIRAKSALQSLQSDQEGGSQSSS